MITLEILGYPVPKLILPKLIFFAFGRTAHYLEHMIGKRGIEQIAGVKRAFDPNTILNIGNMGILGR